MEEKEHHPKHPWWARTIALLLMLLLSFIGLIIADLETGGAWTYWRIMVPLFALLGLVLSWYLRKTSHWITFTTFWHEIVHWLGLIAAVYLVSIYVDIGLIGRFQAALIVMTLLALTLFLGGLYIEISFLPLGLLIGVFAAGAAILTEYIYTIMLPLTIGVGILLYFIVHRKGKRKSKEDNT